MKKKIILYGVGGHLNSVLDVISYDKKFQIEALADDNSNRKRKNFKFIKSSQLFTNIEKSKKNIHLSFASIYNLREREKIFLKLCKTKKYKFPKIISPLSNISKNSTVGDGTIIFHNVLINSNVSIGSCVVINSKALIEHDVVIGQNTHISTGAIINGGVKIGKNCFIGSGSVIKENVVIRDNTFIKMGSVIKK